MMDRKKHQTEFEMVFFEGVLKRSPGHLEAITHLAEIYTRQGFYDKGLQMDRKLSRLKKHDPVVHYNLACSLALVGQKKQALTALRRAVKLGYRDFEHIRRDQDLKSLHTDPAFQKILKTV